MACGGDDSYKNLKLKKKCILLYYIYFFHVITAQLILKGIQNIQGFNLIRAVLFLSPDFFAREGSIDSVTYAYESQG